MPHYKKCGPEVRDLASEILNQYESHKSLVDQGVKVDFLFAYGDRDPKNDELVGPALTKNGVPVLGICKIVNLKDRTKGLGDAEICIDGDWWDDANIEQQSALLDHELHHIALAHKRDNLGRPKLVLRKHDFEFGWFTIIAARHGNFSMERQQAKQIVEIAGQFYFPSLIPNQTIEASDKIARMTVNA